MRRGIQPSLDTYLLENTSDTDILRNAFPSIYEIIDNTNAWGFQREMHFAVLYLHQHGIRN